MKAKNIIGILTASLVCVWAFQACGGSGTPPPKPVIDDINGGVAGSGTMGSLFVIDGTGFGTATSAGSGYSVAFRDEASNTVVANATVDFAGGGWSSLFIRATVPNGLTVGTTYKVTVTNPGGTSNAANFLVTASVSFSPSTILWSATASLPEARQGFAAVAGAVDVTTFIYAIGGNTATSGTAGGLTANVATVFVNEVSDADGTLVNADWTATAPLPGPRGFAAAVFAHKFNSLLNGSAVYVLGGLDETGSATSTVYFAKPAGDGTIPASGAGSWTSTTALPQALSAASAVIFNGRIYIAGGNGAAGEPVAAVYAAKINSDGTVGNWSTLTDMPVPLAFHQLDAIAGTLYVLGGDNAAADPLSNVLSAAAQDAVYFNPIDLATGSLAASWTTNPSTLVKAREKFSAVAAGSYILVSGGLYTGSPGSSEESFAAVNPDGTLGSFNGATGTHTIENSSGYSFYNHAHAFVVDSAGNPHVIILSGADVVTAALHPQVWVQH